MIMKNKETLEKQLRQNKLMNTYEQIGEYEDAVDSLFNKNNPDCIYSLINGFDDNTENHEVMFSNLHGIEYFSKSIGLEKYIDIIIPLLKVLQIDAYDWSKTFYLRLLNSDDAFNLIFDKIEGFEKQERQIIRTLTKELIDEDSTRFGTKGKQILGLLTDE